VRCIRARVCAWLRGGGGVRRTNCVACAHGRCVPRGVCGFAAAALAAALALRFALVCAFWLCVRVSCLHAAGTCPPPPLTPGPSSSHPWSLLLSPCPGRRTQRHTTIHNNNNNNNNNNDDNDNNINNNDDDSIVETNWGMRANHGGGYTYRLCPAGANNLTEACFQAHPVPFTGDQYFLCVCACASSFATFSYGRTNYCGGGGGSVFCAATLWLFALAHTS
jgi:hypothetical protein